jgi:predicted enzyme related to lactoylglutathione lyase
VTEGGGAILMGPHPVPGGDRILIATDPQGALFALTGPA